MGYSTQFKGRLDFAPGMTVEMLAKVKEYFGKDGREIMQNRDADFTYIDLELTDDFKGVQWDTGTEKNCGMVDAVTYIIQDMRKTYPTFGLQGEFLAQGEDIEDRWKLICTFENDFATKVDVEFSGKRFTCPDCGHQWIED